MKILHSSDWHIGRALYEKKRYREFEMFLNWLLETIKQQEIDVLLVAGDIFDTSTPGTRSQEIYYRFMYQVASSSCCRHVVVIGGNHDSPSFLSAPKDLLKVLNVHVIGSVSENCEDEVLVLKNRDDLPELIVCAVPYLRDRDIRLAQPGESIEEKEKKLIEGIREHYFNISELAEKKRKELKMEIPIIAMGHLFTAGGKTVDGDGVRDLYVGSLAHLSIDIFPSCIDYLALGHLHIPQKAGESDFIRYSGSPLQMSFGEATQQKSICVVEFEGRSPTVSLIQVPVFQKLESIRGSWDQIEKRITELLNMQSSVWVEVIYEGEEVIGNLRERLEHLLNGSEIEILRVKNNHIINMVLNKKFEDECLDDLSVDDVFERCLDLNEVPPEQRAELLNAYQEIVISINEEDKLETSLELQ
jgi:exonuclease SbcD